MIGALLGDMIGAPYEFDRGGKTKAFPLFAQESRFTDDSVMTAAVADALMESRGKSDAAIRAALVRCMQRWGRAYPHAGLRRAVQKMAAHGGPAAERQLRQRLGDARLCGRLAL